MRHIKASEFKAKCLKLMDEVENNGQEFVVTKNGRPVAKLVAITEKPKKLWYFGMGKGEFEIVGDIVGPIVPPWNVDPMLLKAPRQRKPRVSKRASK